MSPRDVSVPTLETIPNSKHRTYSQLEIKTHRYWVLSSRTRKRLPGFGFVLYNEAIEEINDILANLPVNTQLHSCIVSLRKRVLTI